ncbi:hypothetical protein [Nocardia thailandica]|uniref:hypothetical protein n=1 Tax=Nocardia thailandica TaxID=257275 RepID=UPI0002EA9F11|nr:hypothetical protein [Nocardia thailandica]
MTADLFDAPAVTIERDGWGRPKIIPPGGGKPVAYTRCTTFVDALEDKHGLTQWKMRQVALGLADRPDLLLAVSAHRDSKDELNRITAAAMDAAGAGSAATTGTALHTLTERHDLGQEIGPLPAAAHADLAAYIRTTGGLQYAAIEQFRVLDDLKVAGTLDRLLEFSDRYVIGDIKTGDITYGIGKIAMQLSVYARAQTYDPATGARGVDAKPIDLQQALIIHLPAGKGTCSLHWVDIAAGWDAVQLAAQVRKWRGRRNLTKEFVPATSPELLTEISAVADIDTLRALWLDLESQGLATDEVTAACKARALELAGI